MITSNKARIFGDLSAVPIVTGRFSMTLGEMTNADKAMNPQHFGAIRQTYGSESRLDYCNALLSGAPAATFDKQRVQNNLARVVCQLRGRAPMPGRCFTRYTGFRWGSGSPIKWLYWLTRCGPQPLQRLSELVQTRAPPRALRSSDAPLLVVSRIHTDLARCTFSVVAPSTCNSLPADIRLCENILTFKRHLKTHLFKLT